MAALCSVGDQGRQMVQCHLQVKRQLTFVFVIVTEHSINFIVYRIILEQAWLDIKVEPKETLEEVKKEEERKDVNKENQREWEVERERRMALDYYVDMATNHGGASKSSSGKKRKRKSDTEKGDGETKERKLRKPRKARAPRKPRDRLGQDYNFSELDFVL